MQLPEVKIWCVLTMNVNQYVAELLFFCGFSDGKSGKVK